MTIHNRNAIAAYVVGLVFALGLGLSGMTQPQKVLGFLDLFGHWDPSLIFVMGGAVGVHFITYRLIRRRPSPLFDTNWHVPTSRDITGRLVIGSVLFGIGWGIAGFCPGPALTSLATLTLKPWVFVGALLVGMLVYQKIEKVLPGKN